MPETHAIFLSYRRSDSSDVTGRICACLMTHFGREVVFRDIHSIPPGVDFRDHLRQAVGRCQVLIAVIGPSWLNADDQNGGRRLDSPNDWVRAEIETALQREIRVIPLLVSGAKLPSADELPESLQALAYRNAALARPDPDFDVDMSRLIRSLEAAVGKAGAAEAADAVSRPQLGRVAAIKAKALEERLAALTQNYEAVSQQLDYTSNLADANKLKLQLQAIERELAETEQALEALNA